MVELRIQALKDSQKSFDLGKFTAISKQQPVVVVENHRPIMAFDAQGNFSEIMVRPLKVSMTAMIFSKRFTEEVTHSGNRREANAFMAGVGVLKAFESRGGKL